MCTPILLPAGGPALRNLFAAVSTVLEQGVERNGPRHHYRRTDGGEASRAEVDAKVRSLIAFIRTTLARLSETPDDTALPEIRGILTLLQGLPIIRAAALVAPLNPLRRLLFQD